MDIIIIWIFLYYFYTNILFNTIIIKLVYLFKEKNKYIKKKLFFYN